MTTNATEQNPSPEETNNLNPQEEENEYENDNEMEDEENENENNEENENSQYQTENVIANILPESKTEDSKETKFLGKKTKRNPNKTSNDYCSTCEKGGGDLISCEECVRSYHKQCLKLTEKEISQNGWVCPICSLKKEKNEKKTKKVTKPKSNIKTQKEKENPQNEKNNNKQPVAAKKKRGKKPSNKGGKSTNSNSNKENNKENSNIENNKQNQNNHTNNNTANTKVNNEGNKGKIVKKKGRKKKVVENPNNKGPNKANTKNEKANDETKNSSNSNSNAAEEEYYGESNLISKTELLNFLKYINGLKDIKSININEINFTEGITKILKNVNSTKAITNLINTTKDLSKYKTNWNIVVDKKIAAAAKHQIHYPIKCKELYSNPQKYELEEKYFNKSKGKPYPYVNGKIFTRLINIYDFFITFGPKIYLNKFTLDELYSALVMSEKNKTSEICLLSSLHISLVYVLFEELNEIPLQELANYREMQLLIIKSILDTKKDDIKKIYFLIYYTWPELVRLFLMSKTFIKDYNENNSLDPVLEKLYNIHDVISYNTSLNFEDKLTILEKLVIISYETNFIRYNIKEGQDQKNKYKKIKKEYDEELKDVEARKSEFERHCKLTQPQVRIEEINKKIEEIDKNAQPNAQNKTRQSNEKMKMKLEIEKKELEKMIKEMNDNNVNREELLTKIEELKEEIFDLPTIGRALLGVDGRGFKYYYFTWMPKSLFIRVKNEKDKNKETKEKYDWNIITDEEELNKDIIDKLSEKGIEELKLKNKLLQVAKKMKNKNDTDNKDKDNKIIEDEEKKTEKNKDKEKENEKSKKEMISIEDIYNKKVLKYINTGNPLGNDKQYKISLITEKTNQYEPICEKIKNVEINISKYLSLDNRQWESPTNRSKVKAYISTVKSVPNLVNILLFFNERIKIPYKSEVLSIADSLFGKSATRKIIEEEKSDDKDDSKGKGGCPLIINGNFEPNYINRDLQYANRIKLWTKEYETYNIEKIYLEYLKNAKGISQVIICLNMFEIAVNELNKRRELNKKKVDNLLPEIMKNDENKVNENVNKNALEGLNNIEIKKPKIKKKKLIDWNVKCMICHEFGELLCCEDCPNVAHLNCLSLTKLPDVWKCSNCAKTRKIIK